MEEELVYGALRREQLWKRIAAAGASFGVIGCLSAAAVAVLQETPTPVVIPVDAETGVAVPNAAVEAVTLTERPAIIQAEIYRYLIARETFNQLDNDLRVRRILAMSDGNAAASLRQLWTSGHANYPPTAYGNDAQIEVLIDSINLLSNNRAQVRFRKRLMSPRGTQTGAFTATLMFTWRPAEMRSIDDVWQNPFGFTVVEYVVVPDRG